MEIGSIECAMNNTDTSDQNKILMDGYGSEMVNLKVERQLNFDNSE